MRPIRIHSPLLVALLLVFACSAPVQTPPQKGAAELGGTSWELSGNGVRPEY